MLEFDVDTGYTSPHHRLELNATSVCRYLTYKCCTKLTVNNPIVLRFRCWQDVTLEIQIRRHTITKQDRLEISMHYPPDVATTPYNFGGLDSRVQVAICLVPLLTAAFMFETSLRKIKTQIGVVHLVVRTDNCAQTAATLIEKWKSIAADLCLLQ